jgi:hypothetical protein
MFRDRASARINVAEAPGGLEQYVEHDGLLAITEDHSNRRLAYQSLLSRTPGTAKKYPPPTGDT